MRRGTKKIRRVFTGKKEYYVYDLDADVFGKRKRIYGDTEGEVRLKIEAAEQERKALLASSKPKSKLLSEYVKYYFRNAISQFSARRIDNLLVLFERNVFGTEFDKDIDTISENEMQEFYNSVASKLSYDTATEIDKVMRKTFEMTNEEGITSFDFEKVQLPDKSNADVIQNYIMTPEEFEEMLSFCIEDNGRIYGNNERLIIAMMMTGLKQTQLKKVCEKDVDLIARTMLCDDRTVQLSEQFASWLIGQALQKTLPLTLTTEMLTSEFADAEIPDTNYTGDELLFANSNGTVPSSQNVLLTIDYIVKRCGFPRVTAISLHKSFVIAELSKGRTAEELCSQLGVTVRKIMNIQGEYNVKQSIF